MGKGMSPLTTTVILLIVSLLIGVLVMIWGRSYVEEAAMKQAGTSTSVQQTAEQSSLFEELDSRLANGEISQDQYDRIKSVMMNKSN